MIIRNWVFVSVTNKGSVFVWVKISYIWIMSYESMCEAPCKCAEFTFHSCIFAGLFQGMAIVFAPQRGETLRLFCQLAQQTGLDVSQHQQYDAQVMDVHSKVRRRSRAPMSTIQNNMRLLWNQHEYERNVSMESLMQCWQRQLWCEWNGASVHQLFMCGGKLLCQRRLY